MDARAKKIKPEAMGAWGLGSDENDWTYDEIGFGIQDRFSGGALTAEGARAAIYRQLLYGELFLLVPPPFVLPT